MDVSSDKFAKKWPHPAITGGQFAPYPSGGRVHSYQHGAKLLDRIAAVYKDAQKLDETETTCSTEGKVGSATHRTEGLGVGEYACYDPVDYAWCDGLEALLATEAPSTVAPTEKPSADESTAAPISAVGLMLALLAQ
jgi:hypothetical protein